MDRLCDYGDCDQTATASVESQVEIRQMCERHARWLVRVTANGDPRLRSTMYPYAVNYAATKPTRRAFGVFYQFDQEAVRRISGYMKVYARTWRDAHRAALRVLFGHYHAVPGSVQTFRRGSIRPDFAA